MVLLIGLSLGSLQCSELAAAGRRAARAVLRASSGMAATTARGSRSRRSRRHRVAAGRRSPPRSPRSSPGRRSCSSPPRSPSCPGSPRTRGRLADDGAPARGGPAGDRRGARPLQRDDPAPRPPAQPAVLAGYELPVGLLGFPGVGWLFAGFPFTASILLLAGPALAWAVIPVAFTPVRPRPAARGRLEESSSSGCRRALLSPPRSTGPRAPARLLEGSARRPGGGGATDPRRRRFGGLALLLVALPFVPAVAGIGGGPSATPTSRG